VADAKEKFELYPRSEFRAHIAGGMPTQHARNLPSRPMGLTSGAVTSCTASMSATLATISLGMTTFEESLQQFDKLLDGTPLHVLTKHRDLIKDVCKKLNKSQGSSASSLLEALDSSRKTIERYTKLPVERAVVCPVDWADVDLRVHDIRLGATGHDKNTKFRKGLGERSLALQYHEWEMREFGCSRLSKLREDPGNAKNVADGQIANFISTHGLPKIKCVEKAIQHGTKLLLLEHLVGTFTTSAVLFFAFGKFRDVNYPEMEDLAASMLANKWIAELIEEAAPWFEDCWTSYEGQYI
jgi:hypothetical protein